MLPAGMGISCTVVTLSGLSIHIRSWHDDAANPLYIVAGCIYFSRYARVTLLPALVAIFMLAATPAWMLAWIWQSTNLIPMPPTRL